MSILTIIIAVLLAAAFAASFTKVGRLFFDIMIFICLLLILLAVL